MNSVKLWLTDPPAATERGISRRAARAPDGCASMWQVAVSFGATTLARRKYCSSIPANDAAPGPSQVGCFAPTARRSSLPPAWQMLSFGFARAENIPPLLSSPCPVSITTRCPLKAALLRTSYDTFRPYLAGSRAKVLTRVTPPACVRSTADSASLRTTSYEASAGISAAAPAAPLLARTSVARGNRLGSGDTKATWPGGFPSGVCRRNFGPFSCTLLSAPPAVVTTTWTLAESSARSRVGARVAPGGGVPRGASAPPGEVGWAVGAGAGGNGVARPVAPSPCGAVWPAGAGACFGWNNMPQARATPRQRAMVRKSRWFVSFINASGAKAVAASAQESGAGLDRFLLRTRDGSEGADGPRAK